MDSINELWVLICGIMVLEMQAGFLCLEAGTVRSKNAVNVALKNLTDLCIVGILYWAVGFAIMFGPTWGGLFGQSGFLYEESFGGVENTASYSMFFFQMAFAGTAVTIVSGAVSERANFHGYLLLSMVAAALIYPVFGHWSWGGAFVEGEAGWLAQLGFLDFAGSTVVHGVGGWIALAYVLAIGPRFGRFGGLARRIEPSNLTLAALGALLLWIGWSGFNAGSTLAFDGDVPSILVNTGLAAAAGGLATLLLSLFRGEQPSVPTQLNATLAGLVAVTASCNIVSPSESLVIGAVGGLVMVASSELLAKLHIDDAVDAVPVHLFAGIWGTLAVALFGDVAAFASGDRLTQLGVQAAGIAAAGVWAFGAAFASLKLIALFVPLRVDRYAERVGLNVAEHNQSSALHDLTEEMRRHRRDGRFKHRAWVEQATEAGYVAKHYNLVLDRAENELRAREHAVVQEQSARRAAELAQEALETAKRQSEWAARHDALTGLANRRCLEEFFESLETASANGETQPIAVICMDLDRFKPINDTYGHAAGDVILRHVADILASECRDTDLVARIGGDEFVVVLETGRSEGEVAQICERLLSLVQRPAPFENVLLSVGASLGFALSDGATAPRDVLVRADLALYEAKENGRNRVEPFTNVIESRARERLQLGEDLKSAVTNSEFVPFFQPQFDAGAGVISGVEALARWRHPRLGMLSPAAFLEIADEAGLTPAIDEMILSKTISALADWDRAGHRVPRVSVNVSAQRLRSDTLLSELRARDDLPKGRLTFEILETVFVDAADERLAWTTDSLKELGIDVEIDDFGTGHASISSILALKPNRLKLDRMFVDQIDQSERRRNLLRSLIGVADSMSLQMVGEGVETSAQADVLIAEGCAHLQGFALAKPMERARMDEWLAAGARPALELSVLKKTA